MLLEAPKNFDYTKPQPPKRGRVLLLQPRHPKRCKIVKDAYLWGRKIEEERRWRALLIPLVPPARERR